MAALPRVLVLGGLDPCGGAGITADARVAQARGCHALPVAACLTVQSRLGLRAIEPTGTELLARMVGAARDDGPLHAVKVGLLGSASLAGRVADLLADLRVPIVIDPVLSATAGGYTATEDLVGAYRRALLPLAMVSTPNLPELARLAPGGPVELLALGCRSVLVKGGHAGGEVAEDWLWSAAGKRAFRHPRLAKGPVHGTGCALATAVACGLAHGMAVEEACGVAIEAVARCLAATAPGGDGLAVPLAIV